MYPSTDTLIFFKSLTFPPEMDSSEKILVRFGKKLEELRKAKKYSTREFADIADISHSSVIRLEAGLTNPSLITLLKLSMALEVDLNTFGDL
jgi:DNA-binding XRE family transcriptional regulator